MIVVKPSLQLSSLLGNMRSSIPFTLLVLILSCNNSREKDQKPAVPATIEYKSQSDTFALWDPGKHPDALQKDIQLDMIGIPKNKKHPDISIVYPKIIEEDLYCVPAEHFVGRKMIQKRVAFRRNASC